MWIQCGSNPAVDENLSFSYLTTVVIPLSRGAVYAAQDGSNA